MLRLVLMVVLVFVSIGAADPREDIIVFRTRTGAKYHERHCQYVRAGAFAVTLKRAGELSLTPCKRCRPPVLDDPVIARCARDGIHCSRDPTPTR